MLDVGLWDIEFQSAKRMLNKLWGDSKTSIASDIDRLNPWTFKSLYHGPYDDKIVIFDMDSDVIISVPPERIPEGTYLVVKQSELSKLLSEDTSTAATGQADDDHMEALPADFRALYNAMGAGELPHLDLLIVAWRHFWKDRRPNDGKDYPINPDVAEWVKIRMDNPEQGNSKAKAIASIIRPIWAPTGRQPNRNQ